MKKICVGLLLVLAVGGTGWADQKGPARILQVEDGKSVTFEQMIDDLKTVRLVFIGELHDSDADHQAQLQVIRALESAGVPLAIGLEMFRKDDQRALDRWVAGEIRETAFLKIFHENWGMWPQYRAIFDYARENRIPMIGLNVSREIPAQVAHKGFSSLSSQQRKGLPAGLTCNASPAYRKFIRRALKGHFHEKASFTHFCEAQMVWDGVMAQSLEDYLATHPGTTIVVLTGVGHAWKYGIPEKVREKSSVSLRVVLPEIPGRIEASDVTAAETDYLLLGRHDELRR